MTFQRRSEREIRENVDLCTKIRVKKTLPAGLARHEWGKIVQSLLISGLRVPHYRQFGNARSNRTLMHEAIINSNSVRILHSGASPLETHP